ncbi:MAG: hypothetical protein LC687_04650 [Actinobacteria bacterium]|nr:hypothetical protein [Actinomycetota bacterium]
MGPQIRKQLNGRKHEIINIDTDDDMSLAALEADIAQHPDNYARVEYMGIEMLVRLLDD